jgi:V8-like Glu-specific endopeptidase
MIKPVAKIGLWCSLLLTTAVTARVIGEDERRAPNEAESDLASALGLVVCNAVVDNQRRRSFGTGTIVGSRSTVLTSAHVLTDDRATGEAFKFDAASDCVFRQYDAFGNVSAEVEFTLAEIGAFWNNSGAPNQDWAVLRTAAPLPESSTALPFATNGYAIEELAGLSIRILAFHADIRNARRTPRLSEGTLFGIDYAGYRRLAHTADTGRMSSGAAIVHRMRDGQNIVVGVNRSSANLGDFNLAVPMSGELAETLKGFAYGQVPIGGQRFASR